MEEKITLCGDNCIECPRYNAHSEAELKRVAELLYHIIIFQQIQKLIVSQYLDMNGKGILQQEISAMRLQLQEIFYRQVIVKMYHHIQARPLCRRLIRGRILSI